ncbi:MAG: dUTP diphosphatase [Aerococcus sp.]|nr:dUTP diphosphatase [Aerococcus sp.]
MKESEAVSVKRGFEVVTKYQDQNIHLPKRATQQSAGYDIEAAMDIVIPSFWKSAVKSVAREWGPFRTNRNFTKEIDPAVMKPTLVPTGLKVYMPKNEYLQLTCRSSNPLKRQLMLPNGVGIIDSDYYNNPDNEGEIFVQLLNFGLEPVTIKKGERIAQGIFLQYLTVDDEEAIDTVRSGGFGSSGVEALGDHHGEEA